MIDTRRENEYSNRYHLGAYSCNNRSSMPNEKKIDESKILLEKTNFSIAEIAKKIVELHEGEIRAESDENGTHFIVTLPNR